MEARVIILTGKKKKNQQFNAGICRKRILTASDYCLNPTS